MGDRIKQIRLAAGLTQQQFAERIGLSRNYIALIETGSREPSDRTISDICREFGVSQSWLQSGEGEMFLPRSKNEELALMVADLMAETDDSFRKRFVSAFLAFPPDKLAVLEEFIDLLADTKNTEDI
nr:MAG TPA: Repressor protein CI [Caudoviricetes sp.]